MSLKISGDHYKVIWDENKCEWEGYVDGMEVSNVRVRTDVDLEQVLLSVVHHLDDLATEMGEVNE